MEDNRLDELNSNTTLYSVEEIENALVENVLKEVCEALKEKGYKPVNQLVGYLMSGDPGYISSHKNARVKMTSLDRSKVLEIILREYIEK